MQWLNENWQTLDATWVGLSKIMRKYRLGSRDYEALLAARNLVEFEMQEQGFVEEYRRLTGR
jgi:hypothetical protein